MSSTTAEKTYYKSPFPEGTPVEELDFRSNSMPKAFFMQLKISGETQHTKMLDKELHDGLRKIGFNLTWEPSPGSGEVGLEGFVFIRQSSGTSVLGFILETSDISNTMQCLALAVVS